MRSRSLIPFVRAVAVAAVLPLVGCASTRTVGEQIDDATITASVKSRLAADPDVSPFGIDVDTLDGRVRLSGNVDKREARIEAERIARDTDGVISVDNDLTVGESKTAGTMVDDTVLVARVKAALIDDEIVSAEEIDVDVDNGVVTLSGAVETWRQKTRATQVAQSVEGVRGVRDLLVVG